MKKLTNLIILFSIISYAQVNDSVTLYDKDYNRIKKVHINNSLETVDSLYHTNNKFYDAFYLISKKDTLFIRRKEQSIRVYKANDGERI